MASNLFPPVPPHTDNYTWHLTETALRDLASHRGKWLGDPLTAITMTASLIDQAERMIPELAADARRQRASWADIAQSPRHQPRAGRTPLQPPIPGPRHERAL